MKAKLTKNDNIWRTINAEKKEDLAEWLAESWIESCDCRDIEYCYGSSESYRIKDSARNIDFTIESPSQEELIERLSSQDWGEYTLEIEIGS